MIYVCYCFVEVFNKNSQEWEFVYNFNEEPFYSEGMYIAGYCNYPKLTEKEESFFIYNTCENALLDCFKVIEYGFTDYSKWNGIPQNTSAKVKKDYDHLIGDVKFCTDASHLYLHQLLDFDYEQTFDIYKLEWPRYALVKEYCYEDRMNKEEMHISYRNYLGEGYFKELESLKQLEDPSNIRLVFFAHDFGEDCFREVESYFKGKEAGAADEFGEDELREIEEENWGFIDSFATINGKKSGEETEKLEYIGRKVRDLFVVHLSKKISGDFRGRKKTKLALVLEVLSEIIILGRNKGKVDISYNREFWLDWPLAYKSYRREMFLIQVLYAKEIKAAIKLKEGISKNEELSVILATLKEDLAI